MKLTKRHVGKLFDVEGGDGSWIYQLIDVTKTELLFYSFGRGEYEIENRIKYKDWRHFKPVNPWKADWIKRGWEYGRRNP